MDTTTKSYWVYVLWSDSASCFYVGLSEDVDCRLQQHNAGLSRWTARHRPWRCVFAKHFPSLTEARRFEGRLKRQKAGHGLFAITGLSRNDFPRPQGA